MHKPGPRTHAAQVCGGAGRPLAVLPRWAGILLAVLPRWVAGAGRQAPASWQRCPHSCGFRSGYRTWDALYNNNNSHFFRTWGAPVVSLTATLPPPHTTPCRRRQRNPGTHTHSHLLGGGSSAQLVRTRSLLATMTKHPASGQKRRALLELLDQVRPLHTHTHTHLRTHLHTYTHTCTHTHLHTHTHTHTRGEAPTHTHTHTCGEDERGSRKTGDQHRYRTLTEMKTCTP